MKKQTLPPTCPTIRPNREPMSQPDHQFVPLPAAALLLSAAGLLASACSTAPPWAHRPSYHPYHHTTLEQEQAAGTTVANAQTQYRHIPEAIQRTVKSMEWGLLRIDGWDRNPINDPADETGVYRAWAVTPTSRRVTILAGPAQSLNLPQEDALPVEAEQGDIIITARIGHFGEPEVEAEFLRRLAREMAAQQPERRVLPFLLPRILTEPLRKLLD